MWRIELTAWDEAEIVRIATERNNIQQRRGVENLRVDPDQSDWQVHYVGTKGEYAFRKQLNLARPPVLPYGDGGKVDAVLRETSLQIKTRPIQGRDLIMPQFKQVEADVVVLLELCGGTVVRAVGWLTKDEWYQSRVERNWGKGPTWMVARGLLRDMDELLAFTGVKPTQAAFAL